MALITCPECSKEISDKADRCPCCAFPIAKFLEEGAGNKETAENEELKQQASDKVYSEAIQKAKTEPVKVNSYNRLGFIITGAIALVALLVLLSNKESIKTTSIKEKQKWFNSAKTLLTDKSQVISDDEIYRIKSSLEAVTIDMSEYAEAQRLLGEFKPRLAKYEKAKADAEKATAAAEEKNRKAAEEARYTKAGKRVHAKHPEWDADECNTIGKGQIYVG